MADQNYILKKLKKIIQNFDPDAEIILYGSRARGTETLESDWDFLVLTRIKINNDIKNKIRDAIYDLELETEEVLTSIIHEKDYWHRPLNQVTPFYQNVTKEGLCV